MRLVQKVLFLLLVMNILQSCDDGDLEFEKIDFQNVSIQSCVTDITTTSLFKVNGAQALILRIKENTLKNEVGEIRGVVPTGYQLLFRSFDGNVSKGYFCTDLPPASPVVISEISAKGGEIIIKTVKDPKDDSKYTHLISIKNLVLENSRGAKLIDSNFDFGTFITAEE